ncbi:uncharacterized protein LOC112503056 [Cynara cardunculus var. scolymus]|uniref:C2 calcium-dependent membrane targeting n=1 Tax=Cynara cardunculus var. scolymus TaxID=59895 RepID=A0A124SH13_CYNCS|nr:uncharacterized protein LOC112503056 [Cynara cardunculus var. scolymus]KVI08116.1 C2 calcium-dependent membrane targeting [Cynara cardunculus var. scolymus]
MAPAKPHQLLEITIMSAQDLQPVARKMKTYATTWLHDNHKLSTRIDNKGGNNPTWNDKFVFRVDDEFLRCEASTLTVEIYSTHWFRDSLIGTVRVLVGNLVPPSQSFKPPYNGGMRCVALQVRRPSGRTQGVLNIGVAVLDSSMRSLPLYRQLSASAVGFRDLMGMEDDESQYDPKDPVPFVKPKLFRSKSEKSSMLDGSSVANSSMVAAPLKIQKQGSMLSESELWGSLMANGKIGKSSSVISGAEPQEKSKSKPNGKLKKANSVISSSTSNTNYIFRPPPKPYSMLSGSEIEPSSSEAMSTMERRYPLEDDMNSSILDSWSLNESEEGLRSKLDRWRSQLPPLYDRRFSSTTSSTISRRKKRHTDGGDNGVFSIFWNICGYECQCVCGQPSSAKTTKAKPRNPRLRSSSSIESGSNRSNSSMSF